MMESQPGCDRLIAQCKLEAKKTFLVPLVGQ